MNARRVIGLGGLLAGVAAATGGQDATRAARPPNVLLIVADDLGIGDVGCYGSLEVATPAIDRLAEGGVRFLAGYSSASICSPSRVGLLTGRYQQRLGYYNNYHADQGGLPAGARTLAEELRDAGYSTGSIGKWHLGSRPENHPLEQGFQEFFGFLGGARSYHVGPDDAAETDPLLRGREPAGVEGHLTELFAAEAEAFVERHAAEPFFLYLSFSAPHTPLEPPGEPPAEEGAAPDRDKYLRLVAGLDAGVRRVLAALDARGLAESTLVVFLSDNGGAVENGASNGGLRGFKNDVFEGGIRVPFVLRWPGRVPAGSSFAAPVSALDVFATAVAAAGVALPGERALDGVDLLPFLAPDAPPGAAPHDALFWEDGRWWAVRKGADKLVCSIFEWRHWLVRPDEADGEAADASRRRPGVFVDLLEAHGSWRREMPNLLVRR